MLRISNSRTNSLIALALCFTSTAALADEEIPDPSQLPFYEKTNERGKSDIKSYFGGKSPKALAVHSNGNTYWWGPTANQKEASRRALENCEFSNKSPCVLAALDHNIQKVDPDAKPLSAFSDFGAELDPGKVPFLSDAARANLAKSYLQSQKATLQYKALALHPRNGWYLKVDPSYASQADANNAALSACVNVAPPNRFWSRGACFLYAEGSRIVATLPQTVTFASAAMVAEAENGQPSNRQTPDKSEVAVAAQGSSGSSFAPPRAKLNFASIPLDVDFADERKDFGVAPTKYARTRSAGQGTSTPTEIPGGKVVTTKGLIDMLTADQRPVVVVAYGTQTVVPGGVVMDGAGEDRLYGLEKEKFAKALNSLSAGDKSRPMVFYCHSSKCWYSYNASLHAIELGYTNVFWYRGGRDSWQAAGQTFVAPTGSW